MNNLQTQECFIKTKNENTRFILGTVDGDKMDNVEHLTDKYILSKSEIEKIISDAFEAGKDFGLHYFDTDIKPYINKQTYIDNLFK